MHVKNCKNCNESFTTRYKCKIFCGRSCASQYNNRNREPLSNAQKLKISESLKKAYADGRLKPKRGLKHAQAVGSYTKGKYRQDPTSIFELSKRTISKILSRLDVGCSNCGWSKGTCDIHHINGRKIANPDNHQNLCILCPNCHRLCHNKKLLPNVLIPLSSYIGDRWKEYYFG